MGDVFGFYGSVNIYLSVIIGDVIVVGKIMLKQGVLAEREGSVQIASTLYQLFGQAVTAYEVSTSLSKANIFFYNDNGLAFKVYSEVSYYIVPGVISSDCYSYYRT